MSDKIKNVVRSIRFESDDWKELLYLANKYDLTCAQIVRKSIKEYLKYRKQL